MKPCVTLILITLKKVTEMKKRNSKKSYILMLNKEDLLQKKLQADICLKDYFPEFSGQNAKDAKDFIKNLFLKDLQQEEIYTYFTTAIDENNIRVVFQNIIHSDFFN